MNPTHLDPIFANSVQELIGDDMIDRLAAAAKRYNVIINVNVAPYDDNDDNHDNDDDDTIKTSSESDR